MRRMETTKKAIRRYFIPRSGTSSHLHGRKFRPKAQRPKRARSSERKPMGQTHEQKDFRKRKAMARATSTSTVAAGCTAFRVPW